MPEFRVTIPLRYKNEPHPRSASVNPDGWIVVEASDEKQARDIVNRHLGIYWGFIYPAEAFNAPGSGFEEAFPAGEVARWDLSTPVAWRPRLRGVAVRRTETANGYLNMATLASALGLDEERLLHFAETDLAGLIESADEVTQLLGFEDAHYELDFVYDGVRPVETLETSPEVL